MLHGGSSKCTEEDGDIVQPSLKLSLHDIVSPVAGQEKTSDN